MTELKTLKDIVLKEKDFPCWRDYLDWIVGENVIELQELKAEAVKWVKYWNSQPVFISKYFWFNKFLEFFNINLTEEDLKQQEKKDE